VRGIEKELEKKIDRHKIEKTKRKISVTYRIHIKNHERSLRDKKGTEKTKRKS